MKPEFPTSVHRQAAEAVVDFSIGLPIQAVLLVNSCARGTATPESDLDIALLIDPELPDRERQPVLSRVDDCQKHGRALELIRVFQLACFISNHHRGRWAGQLHLHRRTVGKVEVERAVLLPDAVDLTLCDRVSQFLIGSHTFAVLSLLEIFRSLLFPLVFCSGSLRIRRLVPFIRGNPVTGDRLLCSREIKLPGAHHLMQAVFEPVLHMRVPDDVVWLRPEIPEAVRAS